jgi:hypothetical protein
MMTNEMQRCESAGERVTTDTEQQRGSHKVWTRCPTCGRKVRAHNGVNEPGTFYAMHDSKNLNG